MPAKSLWGKAFWKDAVERTISAMAQSLLLFLGADQLPGNVVSINFDDWRTWVTILAGAALIQMCKNLIAVTANPNSGASFGASVPVNLVQGQTTVKEIGRDGYIAKPGDIIAGKGLADQTDISVGEPVYVKPVPVANP